MELTLSINAEVDTGDDEVDERVLDITREEALKFVAALSDRLEAEGIENLEVRLRDDEG